MGNKYEDGYGARKRSGKSGSTSRLARLAGNGMDGGGRADWGDVLPETIVAIVIVVTRLGGAVSFGQSRDRGAYSVTVFLDGDRRTDWVKADENTDANLWRIHEMLAALE